jgi:hypothetical protein
MNFTRSPRPKVKTMAKFIKDYRSFSRLTGMLTDLRYSHGIDLDGSNAVGTFRRERVGVLLDFCERNQQYHVVSFDGTYYFNKYAPHARVFLLAEGDKDPGLLFMFTIDLQRAFDLATDQKSWNSLRHKVLP